ncbi:hypothetical protein FB45DRAFT_1084557 [Roridomyces roridus]|uniref:F-box domain-containing protein n=1 Tax=Roridomyces roridus TaxID=1738132 RepID=A0AAD7BN52_9AGAR|nr:hypothetical protein FB45DRAFT_1084557 [Roridomyces roridus]
MESPFAQHLGTNFVPSDSEAQSIRLHLRPYELEIDPHKVLISPVRRLPPELFQEIFLACLPTEHNAIMSVTQPPLIFGRICSGWRALALSTAALWASLHLPLDYIFDKEIPDAPMTWLERSRGAPISLSIVGAYNKGRWWERAELKTVVDVLDGSAYRWESVDLSFRPDEGMLLLKDVAAPNLVALRIEAKSGQIEQMQLLKAQSLRSVTILLTSGDLTHSIPRFPFPWDNLTFVKFKGSGSVGGMPPPFALALLAKCSAIIHFETDLDSTFPMNLSVHRPSHSPRCVGKNSISYLIRHLFMPSLRTLHLPRAQLTSATPSAHDAFPFLGDLPVSSPLIKDLRIDLSGIAPASLLPTLRALTSLKKLAVHEQRGLARPRGPAAERITAQQLIALLTPDTTPPSICPVLEELHIGDCVSVRRDADVLEFAHRRVDHGAGRFRLLVVWHLGAGEVIAPEILESLRAKGLTLRSTRPVGNNGPKFTPWTGTEKYLLQLDLGV